MGKSALHLLCRRCGRDDLAAFGPGIEHHALYPERTNVQIAQLSAPIIPHAVGNGVWGITLRVRLLQLATWRLQASSQGGLTGVSVRYRSGRRHPCTSNWREGCVLDDRPSAQCNSSGVL